MNAKLKKVLVAIGAVLISVLTFILGRRSRHERSTDLTGIDETLRRTEADIRRERSNIDRERAELELEGNEIKRERDRVKREKSLSKREREIATRELDLLQELQKRSRQNT